MTSIVIDIGRLQRRLGRATPTGVDRVILAYATHFRSAFPNRIVFTRSVFGRPVAYRPAHASAILNLTEENWSGRMSKSARGGRKLNPLLLFLATVRDVLRPTRLVPKDGSRAVYFTLDHNGLEKNGPVQRMHATGAVDVVAFLHDLIPLTHPEYVVPRTVPRHVQRMVQMGRCCRLVIANSRYTEGEFHRHLKSVDCPVPETLAAPLGIEDVWEEAREEGREDVGEDVGEEVWRTGVKNGRSQRPYFVILGTIEARKNHVLLLAIWRKLSERLGDKAPILHVVGRRGWEAEVVEDMLDRCPALKSCVVERSGLADAELKDLLQGARALLFPSHVEGFGLPLAEALAGGIPVVASDIAVFREIAASVPDYYDPLDGLGWERAILDYAEDGSPARNAQLRRMSDFQPTYWPAHFKLVEAEMAGMLGS